MRPVHRSWLGTLAVGAVALTACTETDGGLTPPAQGEDLLTISSMQSLTAAQEREFARFSDQLEAVGASVASLSSRAATLLQEGRRVGFNVSPTERFVAVGEDAFEQASGSRYWSGSLQGVDGWADVLLTSGGVRGRVHTPDYIYSFPPIGNGLHAVVELDRKLLVPEDPPGGG